MTNMDNVDAVHRFGERLASALNNALADMFTAPSPLRVMDGCDGQLQETTAMFHLTVDGALTGICLVEFRESQIEKLVGKEVDDPSDSVAAGHEELFRIVMETASSDLSKYLSSNGEEVTVKLDVKDDPNFKAKTIVSLIASEAGQHVLQVLVHLDCDLVDGMCSSRRARYDVESASRGLDAANLELVMDVELSVSLRFGRCKMQLRDVLELTSGYVFQLDREVDDPVELVLDGRVIARGEAVVIDGNYGLRVTELSAPAAAKIDRPIWSGQK
jgi:flagellar motor switch protein FliN/FliY